MHGVFSQQITSLKAQIAFKPFFVFLFTSSRVLPNFGRWGQTCTIHTLVDHFLIEKYVVPRVSNEPVEYVFSENVVCCIKGIEFVSSISNLTANGFSYKM